MPYNEENRRRKISRRKIDPRPVQPNVVNNKLAVEFQDDLGPTHLRRFIFPIRMGEIVQRRLCDALEAVDVVRKAELIGNVMTVFLRYRLKMDRFHSVKIFETVQATLHPIEVEFTPYNSKLPRVDLELNA